MSILVESETVMFLGSVSSPGGAMFTHAEDTLPIILLRSEDWQEMGEPTVITVTVKPGDHLNQKGADN